MILDRLGHAYRALDRLADAIRVLRKAAGLAPGESTIQLHLGNALAEAGANAEAEVLMDRFRQMRPAQAPRGLMNYLSLTPEQQREDYRARVEKAVRDNPGDANAQLHYLKLSLEDNQMDQAAAMHQAIEASPKRPELYWQAAVFLSRQGRGAEAVKLLDRAEQLIPQDPQIPLVRATLLELTGQSEDAERLLDKVQRRWPEAAAVWVARGIILASHRHFDEPRRALETAVRLGARSPEAWFYLADRTIRSAPGRIDDADAAIRKALALAPEDPLIQTLAGQIARRKGDSKTIQGDAAGIGAAPPDPGRLFRTRPPQDW